jgi:hypothetical protein
MQMVYTRPNIIGRGSYCRSNSCLMKEFIDECLLEFTCKYSGPFILTHSLTLSCISSGKGLSSPVVLLSSFGSP